MIAAVTAAFVVFVPMAVEAAVSARHDRALRALGALEPPGDVYRAMLVAYPAGFLAMLVEGAWRGAGPDTLAFAGAFVFIGAKALKYWAMATLGPRWTFRVLVPPGSRRTVRGPYRWMAHPNYAAVALELAGVALALHALVSGPITVAGFVVLMRRRIHVEERALGGRMPSG